MMIKLFFQPDFFSISDKDLTKTNKQINTTARATPLNKIV